MLGTFHRRSVLTTQELTRIHELHAELRLLKCSEALRDFARRIAKRCDLTDLLPTLHCACLITGEPERIAEMQHGRNGWITRCEPQCGAEERDRARAVGTVLQFALAVTKHAERI